MYINSNNIVVYPTLKRNNNNIETSSIISEQGITSLINRLTENKSYVIDGLIFPGKDSSLSAGSCNICGYKFTISENQTLTVLENSKYLYLKMNCTETTSKNNISPLSLKGFDVLTKEKEYNTNNLQYSGLDIIFTNSILNDKNNAKYLLIAEKRENKWLDYTQFAPTKTNLINTNLYGFDDGELYEGTKISFSLDETKSISVTFIPVDNCVVNFGNKYANIKMASTPITITNTYNETGDKTIIINGKFKLSGQALGGKNTNIKNVQLSKDILKIGDDSFKNCVNLPNITIPASVTSIGNYAFYNCHSLTSITIPDSVTNIGDYIFEYCSNLKSITIPNSVTSIGNYAFSRCSELRNITISNSVTSIGDWAFSNCSSLTSITIPNSVTSIGNRAFNNCSGLENITLPNSITSIKAAAFFNCPKLSNVTFIDSKNWTVTKDSTTIQLKETDLKDTTKAAEYLTKTYVSYEWTKKE